MNTSYTPETLKLVRQAVTQVARRDCLQIEATAPLGLDSIARIALVAELENTFALELDAEDVVPEIFVCLASLASMIEARRA